MRLSCEVLFFLPMYISRGEEESLARQSDAQLRVFQELIVQSVEEGTMVSYDLDKKKKEKKVKPNNNPNLPC